VTAPRQILPGSTYLVTRRCTQRQFLLRPSRSTNQLVGYLLAVAAERYHIDFHAFCVMSNHIHLVVTDPEARLPAFFQYLDSLVGRSMNALVGHRENFWASSTYSAVALQGPADVVDKIAYVLANPVAAGLVQRGRMWPGLWSAPARVGGEALEFTRPDRFFRKKGPTALPERARLSLLVPPGFRSPSHFRRAVTDALELKEETAAVDRAAKRRGFLGVQRVLAQRPFACPHHPEPLRTLNPRVASKDTPSRIQALARLVDFLRAYRAALAAWRAHAKDVLFPAGTYLMRVSHRAPCQAPG
jgi:REP element-mobilizing transposase RayT